MSEEQNTKTEGSPTFSKTSATTAPSTTSPPQAKEHKKLTKEKLSLKLILASGKNAEFIFPLITSVGEVTEYVYNNWPDEWADEKESITSHHVLRLIYQGRFLHENVTFLALNLPAGKRTVMHLVPREKLPQLSPDDMEKSPKSSDRSCCCTIL